jgi:hypothetical protein
MDQEQGSFGNSMKKLQAGDKGLPVEKLWDRVS